jgi:hypothetical protein
MPENLAEVHIDFLTGQRATSSCSQELVAVAVPAGAIVPATPNCQLE